MGDDGSLLDRIDQVCQAFEEEWAQGRSDPSLSEYLRDWSGEARSCLFAHLLELELEIRSTKGELPDAREYSSRFPDFADIVSQTFEQHWGFAANEPISLGKLDTSSEELKQIASLGRYQVRHKVGDGSFGTVYLARDVRLERDVALKTLKRRGTPSQTRRLTSEARNAAALSHPSIVRVIDVEDSDDGFPFIVMQYVAGCSLKKEIGRRRFGWAEAARFVIEIAKALEHAHNRGFVHRDLKPANILIDDDRHPYIVDFGLALHIDEHFARAGEFVGSLHYMAPEQIRGDAHRISAATDVWALCAIFFELLTGKKAFDGSDPEEIAAAIVTGDAARFGSAEHEVPSSIKEICLRGLSTTSGERFGSASELMKEVRTAVATETRSSIRRHKSLVVTVAAGLAMVLVIASSVAYWSVQQRATSQHELAATRMFSRLLDSEIEQTPSIVSEIQEFLGVLTTRLEKVRDDGDPGRRLRASLALLSIDKSQSDFLYAQMLESDSRHFCVLLDALQGHDADIAKRLRNDLSTYWPVSKTGAPEAAKRAITDAKGMIANGHGFCQKMPLGVFLETTEKLEEVGLRPIRFRPFAQSGKTFVAGIWAPESRSIRLFQGLSADELVDEVDRQRRSNFYPIDVARLVDPVEGERFSGLWRERRDGYETRVVIGNAHQSNQEGDQLVREGFHLMSLQTISGDDGSIQCSVWSEDETIIGHRKLQQELHPDFLKWLPGLQTDFAVSRSTESRMSVELLKQKGVLAEQALAIHPDAPMALMLHAQADYFLRNDLRAIETLSRIIEECPTHRFNAYSLRARAYARLKMKKEARSDLANCMAQELPIRYNSFRRDAYNAWLTTIVSVHLEETEAAFAALEHHVEANERDTEYLIYAACAYAEASAIPTLNDAKSDDVLADRALALLGLAIENGFSYFDRLKILPELDPLRDRREFWDLFSKPAALPSYTAVWQDRESEYFESTPLLGLPPEQHLKKSLSLEIQGYVPHSISVAEINCEEPLVSASVWHRLRSDGVSRLANVALALMYLDEADAVWPLLRQHVDPRLRTLVINRMAEWRIPAETLVGRLAGEEEPSIRQALILAIGEFQRDQLTNELRQETITTLLNLYEDDPHPGVHGATAWLLRRWGQHDLLAQKDGFFSTGEILGNRRWFLTRNGQAMTVIRAPGRSWASGPRELNSPPVTVEDLRPMRVEHDFAIAVTEVTVSQFRRCFPTFEPSSAANVPAAGITWFQAAEYCNWLSQQEGMPSYYQFIRTGDTPAVRLPPNGVLHHGYRLPTELEWELACRSDAFVNCFIGEGEEMLGKYSWHANNAGAIRPVGQLKPNDLGIFDGLGNCLEYCQNRFDAYVLSPHSGSIEIRASRLATVHDERAVRGASFALLPSEHRMNFRVGFLPHAPRRDQGFRVARTLEPLSAICLVGNE